MESSIFEKSMFDDHSPSHAIEGNASELNQDALIDAYSHAVATVADSVGPARRATLHAHHGRPDAVSHSRDGVRIGVDERVLVQLGRIAFDGVRG